MLLVKGILCRGGNWSDPEGWTHYGSHAACKCCCNKKALASLSHGVIFNMITSRQERTHHSECPSLVAQATHIAASTVVAESADAICANGEVGRCRQRTTCSRINQTAQNSLQERKSCRYTVAPSYILWRARERSVMGATAAVGDDLEINFWTWWKQTWRWWTTTTNPCWFNHQ